MVSRTAKRSVLGRDLTPDEAREAQAILRRLTALILLTPETRHKLPSDAEAFPV